MDLPEELLGRFFDWLEFQEVAVVFAVNKAWKRVAQKTGVVAIDQEESMKQ
jgi:hypothetical protein